MPLFTIITINFNQANGLSTTIDSVKKQTYKNYEFIIIDGKSTDQSTSIIEINKNIVNKSVSERDNGIYDAMNKGLKLASGDWVVFMNSGDTFYDITTLENMSNLINNKEADVFYGNTEIKYLNFSRIQKAYTTNYWKAMPFIHQSLYCKRKLLLLHTFNLDYKICADYELYQWLVSEKKQLSYIDDTLSIVSSGGTSDKKRAIASLEKLKILRSYSKKIEISKSVYFYFEFSKGMITTIIKSILPSSFINYLTKLKYNMR